MIPRAVTLIAAFAVLAAGCLGAPNPAALNNTDKDAPWDPTPPPSGPTLPTSPAAPQPGPSRSAPAITCRFAPCEVEAFAMGAEPWVAINPANPDHAVVVAMSFHRGSADAPASVAHPWLAAAVTRDGGASWSTSIPPGGPNGPTSAFATYDFAADTMVAFANDGSVVLASLAGRANPTLCIVPLWQCANAPVFANALDLVVWRSTDGGATWKEGAVIDRGVGFFTLTPQGKGPLGGYNDRETIAVDPATGTVHLVWSSISNLAYDIRTARSNDHGATWSEPEMVATGHYGVTAAALDNVVLVTFRNTRTGDHALIRSADGGATWSEPTNLGHSGPPNQQPVPVALWRAGATLHAVLAQSVGGANEDLVVRASRDGGVTWGEPVPAPVSGATERRLPALAVDPATGLGVLATYRGADAPEKMALWVVPLAGGLPSGQALQVSNRTADPGAAFDYLGVAASPTGGLVAWGVRAESGAIATATASLAWSHA